MSAHETRADTPDARASLAGEGATTLRAGNLDVPPSVKLGPAGAATRRASFSEDEFRACCQRVFAAGGGWAEVAQEAGTREDVARRRGVLLDIQSPRGQGKVRRWTASSLRAAADRANEIGTLEAAAELGMHASTLRKALQYSGWRRAWVRS